MCMDHVMMTSCPKGRINDAQRDFLFDLSIFFFFLPLILRLFRQQDMELDVGICFSMFGEAFPSLGQLLTEKSLRRNLVPNPKFNRHRHDHCNPNLSLPDTPVPNQSPKPQPNPNSCSSDLPFPNVFFSYAYFVSVICFSVSVLTICAFDLLPFKCYPDTVRTGKRLPQIKP